MSNRYSDIDVMTFVQGNTARKAELYTSSASRGSDRSRSVERGGCVVYDFRVKETGFKETGSGRTGSVKKHAKRDSLKNSTRVSARKTRARRAARARARKVFALRTAFFAFLVMFTMFGIGGIASRAKSREVPDSYKYYDTITVGYQENLLDIVERYDDRDHYETQLDYVEELCRINNLAFDGTAYPAVTPGTHLVVPYYSTELK